MRVRGTVEYLGTKWSGWQLQPDAPTIQGEIERALAILAKRPVRVHAAGRTDAGVHASGQVISFDVDDETDLERLARSLNAVTDASISILGLVTAPSWFDPRRQARSRTYEYTIVNARPPSPFLSDRSWHVHAPLDVELLQRLAASIAGEHDFAAFRASDCASASTLRFVTESRWLCDPPDERGGAILTYRVSANAFLKQMVRTLVGSMIEVALGRLPEETFVRLLDGGSRDDAGQTAPAAGLALVGVDYPEEVASG